MLAHDIVQSGIKSQTFRSNLLTPSSDQKI